MVKIKNKKILVYNNGDLSEDYSHNHTRLNKDNIKTIVIKSGTSVVTDKNSMNLPVMAEIARQLSVARKQYDLNVIYVSSGAIGFGMIDDCIAERPTDIAHLMELSTTGQPKLFSTYSTFFENYGVKTNQILVNEHDLESRNHINRLKNVFEVSFKKKKIPIINANDATWAVEIEESDNDYTSSVIAENMNADLLIILSNIDGLYTNNPKNPGARLIQHIHTIDEKLVGFANGKSALGSGGAESKFKAGKYFSGPYVVANGKTPNAVLDILEGKIVGSYFEGRNR